MILLIFAVIIVFAGIGIFMYLLGKRRDLGILAQNKPIYQDTTELPGDVLYAKSLPLVGKPDYLIKQGKEIIPVEIKTGRSPREYFLGHNMQLMAYCLLVEENYGIRPRGGIIQYKDKELKLAYTKEAETSVRRVVKDILTYKQTQKEPHCRHANHNK